VGFSPGAAPWCPAMALSGLYATKRRQASSPAADPASSMPPLTFRLARPADGTDVRWTRGEWTSSREITFAVR
jgi:hypothetical protein